MINASSAGSNCKDLTSFRCFLSFKGQNRVPSFLESWYWYNASLPGNFGAQMSTEQPIELEGVIKTVLPGTMFRVTLDNQHEVLAHISGKMRKHFVRLTVGDRVRLEMSPYDLTKARITFRLR
jgi:translation initiation factor IF-1